MGNELTLNQLSETEWELPAIGRMRVPGRIVADSTTIRSLLEDEANRSDWSALQQVANVACLPGIVGSSLALPDVHPGYGFPIGGVAAFDLHDGVAVVGGVGFDINCGVRMLATPLSIDDLMPQISILGEQLYQSIPAGLGAQGELRLSMKELDQLLLDGAPYLIRQGFGVKGEDEFIEDRGCLRNADPDAVSDRAKQRQFRQVGTLGSGNHYLEIQSVEKVLDPIAAEAYGLKQGQVVLSIHTGSRALGHQIGQDYLKTMAQAASSHGIEVPERELVCAPITSAEGQRYLAAVACGANCAFANRQMITHLARGVLKSVLGLDSTAVRTVYDIGHNNAKVEIHELAGESRELLVHRKGSTRAFGPGRKESPTAYRAVGHPILVGGTMGTRSYVLRGTAAGMRKAFGSGIHGAGRALSRKKAAKRFWGETIQQELQDAGIHLWAHSFRSVAEEAPLAYKDVEVVVDAAVRSGINAPVARLRPHAVIKG